MFNNISVLRFAICFFCSGAQATGPGFWVVPDGADSDLSQSFPANTPLDLSWTGQPALSSFTNFDNKTTAFGLFDLYVTNFQPGGKFSQLVTTNVNLTNAGSFRWDVALPASVLAETQQFVLRFIVEPNNITGFPSPGFLIQGGLNSASFSTSTSSSTFSSTSTPSTITPTVNSAGNKTAPLATPVKSGSLSTGVKAAIGVIIPVVILPLLCGAYHCYVTRSKVTIAPENQVREIESDKEISVSHPVELLTVERAGELPHDLSKNGVNSLQHEIL